MVKVNPNKKLIFMFLICFSFYFAGQQVARAGTTFSFDIDNRPSQSQYPNTFVTIGGVWDDLGSSTSKNGDIDIHRYSTTTDYYKWGKNTHVNHVILINVHLWDTRATDPNAMYYTQANDNSNLYMGVIDQYRAAAGYTQTGRTYSLNTERYIIRLSPSGTGQAGADLINSTCD